MTFGGLKPTLLVVALAGCGYSPPPQTDTAEPAYVAARDSCTDSSASAVNKQNAKTGLAWFASPFRRWGQIADATQACMVNKGYGRVRWCTAEELRSGNRQGNMIVTSAGVQCSDPPLPPSERPAGTSPPATETTASGGKKPRR